MKKISFAIATSAIVIGLMAAPALASNGAATQYTASYTFGPNWTCSGVRVVNKNQTKDSFSCTLTNISANLAYASGTWTEASNPWGGGWASDFDGASAKSFTLTVTPVDADTSILEGVAYY